MKDYQKKWALSTDGWKLPGEQGTFNLNEILSDEKLCEKYRLCTFYKEEWFNENDIEQRYIVTFSLKYMNYQRNIRNEQIERAKKAVDSNIKTERTRQSDYKRFITKTAVTDNGEVAVKKVYTLTLKRAWSINTPVRNCFNIFFTKYVIVFKYTLAFVYISIYNYTVFLNGGS